MANYAIIKDNTVINTCVWDGEAPWQPPEDTVLVNIDNKIVGVGYTYNNGEFTAPVYQQVGDTNDNDNYS